MEEGLTGSNTASTVPADISGGRDHESTLAPKKDAITVLLPKPSLPNAWRGRLVAISTVTGLARFCIGVGLAFTWGSGEWTLTLFCVTLCLF